MKMPINYSRAAKHRLGTKACIITIDGGQQSICVCHACVCLYVSVGAVCMSRDSVAHFNDHIRYGVVANISRSHLQAEGLVPRSPGFDSLYRSLYLLLMLMISFC